MPELLRSRQITARKPHSCDCCGAVAVRPGETYNRDTYVFDGRVYDWVSCAGCDDVQGDVFAWVEYIDDGVTADDYAEWAQEHAGVDDRARAYLERPLGAIAA